VKGNLKDVDGMVKAMEKANFNSLRGPFTFNVNHHPIQNFYLLKTEKLSNGDIEMRIQKTIFEKHKDSYFQDCKMK
jgi:branched-chain amino acid transport system substrate-binding protein